MWSASASDVLAQLQCAIGTQFFDLGSFYAHDPRQPLRNMSTTGDVDEIAIVTPRRMSYDYDR